MDNKPSRREFIASSASLASASWIALNAGALATLSACARDAAQRGAAFTTLEDAEGLALAAFARQILPSDDGRPGAEEAGAVHFMDQVLAGPFAGMRQLIADGARDLDARAASGTPPAASFAELTSAQQVEVMRAIEETPFFGNARMLTVAAVFSDPSWGGNRGGVGFDLLQIEHAPAHQPPFGYYDRELLAGGGAA